MNNDYERYDFWHREIKSIKPTVSMEKLIESNRLFDEKNRKDSNTIQMIEVKTYQT